MSTSPSPAWKGCGDPGRGEEEPAEGVLGRRRTRRRTRSLSPQWPSTLQRKCTKRCRSGRSASACGRPSASSCRRRTRIPWEPSRRHSGTVFPCSAARPMARGNDLNGYLCGGVRAWTMRATPTRKWWRRCARECTCSSASPPLTHFLEENIRAVTEVNPAFARPRQLLYR